METKNEKGVRLMKNKNYLEIPHYYKSGGFNHLVDVSTDNDLFAAITFTDLELKEIYKKYPLAKDNLFALVDGVEIKLQA